MTSVTSSSQSETGFFGQATKLVASMLGGGKKEKPEIKSLQRAAAMAKRQQDEADKKALRLKEMEVRRQAILSRKAEEEKARILEDEKKTKENSERRKREREENTDKRPVKLPTVAVKKMEDDSTKKRKFVVETQKKVEAKKPVSKDKKEPVPFKLVKPSVPTPTAKPARPPKSVRSVASALVSSAAYNVSQNLPGGSSGSKPAIPEAKPFKLAPNQKDKGKAVAQNDGSDKLPSAMIQTQMAARAKAQIEASKQQATEVPSESIELPEINSEYSDSEDENRVRTFDPPDWAQSPELRQALQMQSTVNPDDIFGAIRPLRMEEMFRTRQSRFRARTSSANWSGADRLTIEEVREYERRMGFQSQA
ncbi:inner centromere protein [Pisolithus orientalis]|uniref:inner centromere protein n=1 Tax=Pisolithus orientalis TaxID=936130 RepID=UPI0022250BDD|nr:inner centromere protein [Pisolithus orientalis]KAI6008196.1 inner centromere protein [Pisolithus orientalis]